MNGIVAEIHFCLENLKPEIIVHESVHAVVAFGKLARLDWETHVGDEAFAECVEHVFCGVKWYLRKSNRASLAKKAAAATPKKSAV